MREVPLILRSKQDGKALYYNYMKYVGLSQLCWHNFGNNRYFVVLSIRKIGATCRNNRPIGQQLL